MPGWTTMIVAEFDHSVKVTAADSQHLLIICGVTHESHGPSYSLIRIFSIKQDSQILKLFLNLKVPVIVKNILVDTHNDKCILQKLFSLL